MLSEKQKTLQGMLKTQPLPWMVDEIGSDDDSFPVFSMSGTFVAECQDRDTADLLVAMADEIGALLRYKQAGE